MPSPRTSYLGPAGRPRRRVSAVLIAITLLATAATVSLSTAVASSARSAASAIPVGVHLAGLAAQAPGAASEASAARMARAGAAGSQPLTPGQIRTAYALPATGARGQTIAVVTAFDDPHAQADLTAYSQQYGIPACTTANHCFTKLNQDGKTAPLPPTDLTGGTWITESAIGTEVSRGLCQSCRILLVEAKTVGRADLSAAVNTAAAHGATVIVTTFTDTEDQLFDSSQALEYSHAKAAVVSATGDGTGMYGYSGQANFPSSLPDVLAVGGTQLSLGRHGAYGSEQAWADSVSGCSLYQPAPLWQKDIAAAVGCQNRRAVADLSAIADPGAVVHITGNGVPGGPWYAATGTSLSAPVIGGVIGLAGSLGSREAQILYARAKSDPGAFHDIRTGVNAPGCTRSICRAGRGYDGPTGLGTPFGLAAFLPSGGALSQKQPLVTTQVSGNRLRANGRWQVSFTVKNGNPFAVGGPVTLRRTMTVGGRSTTVKFATGKVKLAPLGKEQVTLTIARGERQLLRQLGATLVYLRIGARGPVAPTVTVSKAVSLSAG